jgi:hypothetical protein
MFVRDQSSDERGRIFSDACVGCDLSVSFLNTDSDLYLFVPSETSPTLDLPFCSTDLGVHLEWCCLPHVHVSEHCSVNICISTICTSRVPTSELDHQKCWLRRFRSLSDFWGPISWWSTSILRARCPYPVVTSPGSPLYLTAYIFLVNRRLSRPVMLGREF